MRQDMAKVIVERPRTMHGGERKGRVRDPEDLPSKISMRKEHVLRGGHKQLNENLAPLRRFVEKQVGRPWDKVFSEICERLRTDSTVQQHVRDHVFDFVDVGSKPASGWRTELYVDRRDGILKRAKPSETYRAMLRRRRKEKPVDTVVVDEFKELRLLDGVWYEVVYEAMPAAVYKEQVEVRTVRLKPWRRDSPVQEHEVVVRRLVSEPVYDVLHGARMFVGPRTDDEAGRRLYGKAPRRYAVSKRQLSGRELRRHGVANAVPPAGPVMRVG